MPECPDLAALEVDPTSGVRDHLAACSSCRIVVELLEERRHGLDARDRQIECARFEMLIAAREEGTIGGTAGELLAAHLRECADCAAVAATLVPANDRASRSSLPAVSTASYALGREVARGGMGRILEALDVRIGRPVAVKELLGKAPSLAARFEREARVTARLQHPGIVPIYEIGKWPDGTPFYAMRMVEGRTLRETLNDKATLDERLALLPALIAAADAVAFAHGKRIIHRDLTPNNILVGAYGDTVVIDWGLAKDLTETNDVDDDLAVGPYRDEPTRAANLTNVGAVIGTAAYMPPEQASGAAVDERADVYAMGAILYHVLAGAPPYRASKSDDVVRQVQAGPPPTITDVALGSPRDLVSIVDKAMSRDPSARYASAAELADELRRFQTGRLVEAHHYSRGERVRRWLGRHRGMVIGVGTAFAALVVIGTFAIAGILAARNRAEAGEREAVRQRMAADQMNAELLEEQGRQALLDGAPVQAAVWLSASYSAGNTRPSLRFLLGTAMRDLESIERRLDCGSEVTTIETSPDKTTVAAACGDSVRAWRISDGALLYTLTAKGASLAAPGFSHDGKRIVTNGSDRVARVWDAATGALQLELGGHAGKLGMIQFTPDDQRVVTASRDRMMRVWDAATGKLLRTIEVTTAPNAIVEGHVVDDHLVMSVSFEGSSLSLPIAGAIKVWDLDSGKLLREIENHSLITSIEQVSHHRVVVCGLDGDAKLFDLDTGQLVHSFSGHSDNLWACVLTPDHRRLVTTSNDRTAKVWDVESGRLLHTLQHDGVVVGAAFAADGCTVVTKLMPKGLKVWDVATGTLLGADDSGGATESADTNLAFVGDRILASADTGVVIYRGLGRSRHIFHAPAGAWIVLASNDGTRALVAVGEVGAADGALTIWDAERGVVVPHEPLRLPAAKSADRVVARSAGGVAIVDMRTGTTVAHLPVESPGAFELSEDARYLLVQRDGAQSEVWDVRRASVIMRWDALDTPVGLESGGDRLVVLKAQVKEDAAAEIWALDPPRVIQRLTVGRTHLVGARFTRDRAHVTLFTNNSVMTVFDTNSGRELRTIHGFMASGFDEDGEIAAVARLGTVQLVRVADGSTLSEFPGQFTAMMSVASGGDFVAGSEGLKSSIELIDATRRVLVELPFRDRYTYTAPDDQHRGSFALGWRHVAFSADGSRLLSAGTQELVAVDLTPEHRDPEAIARTVRERAQFKVDHGQLTPIAVEAARLRGRVTREGASVAGATVIAMKRDGSPLATVVTNATGDYELLDLSAGPIRLTAQSLKVGAFARFRAVTLASGDNHNDLEMDLAGSISGRVVDESGRPVAGVHIHADCSGCADGDSGDDTSTADGDFELRALMGGGAYTLHALDIGIEEHLIPAAPGQAPIAVKDGKDHVTGVRFIVVRPP